MGRNNNILMLGRNTPGRNNNIYMLGRNARAGILRAGTVTFAFWAGMLGPENSGPENSRPEN